MGAWGRGPFDNDDAADWLSELQERGLPAVEAAVEPVAQPEPGYLDAGAGARAVAAAEVVAALGGAPARELPAEVTGWLASEPRQHPGELVVAAKAAVLRVTGDGSELAELWDSSGEGEAWRASLADLHRRLSDVP